MPRLLPLACWIVLASTAVLAAGPADVLILRKDDGYRGIWYANQPQGDQYVYKYSGGLGTYCTSHSPFAIYRPEVEKTFFCYGGTVAGNKTLLHMVSYFDHRTGTVPRPTILLDKKTDDAHDNPVLAIDAAGHLWIFSSSHGTGRPSYISRSKEPYSIDDFEIVTTTNFSYTQPWYIAGEGFLFLHTRYGEGGRRLFQMTSPDGRQWSAPQKRVFIEQGHYEVSWAQGKKVGTAFNFHPAPQGLNWRTNLYYMETDNLGRTWRTADGQVLSLPITQVDNPALIHNYRAENLKVYVIDVNFDAAGRPVVLFLTSRGWQSGPENGPRTWRTARWTGSAWEIREVTTVDNNYDAGALSIEADGLWRIIGPTEPGPQAYNTGGEVVLWTSADQGQSWQRVAQLTQQSEYNHTYCRKPVAAHPDFYALWADGHGRQVSPSRLYFCDQAGQVFLLPPHMEADTARPSRAK